MYCRHCGKENINEAKFCSTCGRPFIEATPLVQKFNDQRTINNPRYSRYKWIIILVTLVILVIIILLISFPRRQEGTTPVTNAINSSNSILLLHDENVGFSLDTVDGYQALNTRIPRHNCEIRTFEDKHPYFTLKKSFNEKFGNGINGSFFIFDYLHWKDQENKNLYLILNKNETILIHSRSNLEAMGLDLIINVIQELNKK